MRKLLYLRFGGLEIFIKFLKGSLTCSYMCSTGILMQVITDCICNPFLKLENHDFSPGDN